MFFNFKNIFITITLRKTHEKKAKLGRIQGIT